MFEKKDDVRFGELHLNITVVRVDGFDHIRWVIEESQINTKKFFIIAVLRDDLDDDEKDRGIASNFAQGTLLGDNERLRTGREFSDPRESSSPVSCPELERPPL